MFTRGYLLIPLQSGCPLSIDQPLGVGLYRCTPPHEKNATENTSKRGSMTIQFPFHLQYIAYTSTIFRPIQTMFFLWICSFMTSRPRTWNIRGMGSIILTSTSALRQLRGLNQLQRSRRLWLADDFATSGELPRWSKMDVRKAGGILGTSWDAIILLLQFTNYWKHAMSEGSSMGSRRVLFGTSSPCLRHPFQGFRCGDWINNISAEGLARLDIWLAASADHKTYWTIKLINIDHLPQQGVGKIHAIEIKIPSVPDSLGIR